MDVIEENKLEKALRLAFNEPAHRPAFYDALISAQVFIIGSAGVEGDGDEIDLEAGSKIHIQHWEKQDGSQVIPFFTSLEQLQQSVESEESVLALPARSFFTMVLGSMLVLNPNSQYVKEFLPDEINRLLSPEPNLVNEQRVIKKDSKVFLGQPAEYPTQMIDSLKQLFSNHKDLKRAYLAQMHNGSSDEKPNLVIGIEVEGEPKKVMNEIGMLIRDTAPQGEPVDLCLVNQFESGLSEYFINDVTPFYELKSKSKLLSWLGLSKA